jgi:hypothetical protein
MDMAVVRIDPEPREPVFGGRGVIVPFCGFKRGAPTASEPPPTDASATPATPEAPEATSPGGKPDEMP